MYSNVSGIIGSLKAEERTSLEDYERPSTPVKRVMAGNLTKIRLFLHEDNYGILNEYLKCLREDIQLE